MKDKRIREESKDFIEYVKLLETKQEDLVDRVKNKRKPMPTQCTRSSDWLANDSGANA